MIPLFIFFRYKSHYAPYTLRSVWKYLSFVHFSFPPVAHENGEISARVKSLEQKMTKLHNDEVRDINLISSVVATELWGYIQLDLKRKLSRNLNFHLCSTLYANLYRAYGMICMINVTRF